MTDRTEGIEQQVRQAVEGETVDVRDSVRKITLKALSSGDLDKAELRRVMDAVVKGGLHGDAAAGKPGRQALREAMQGLDEALAAAAAATQLALQEAAGRGDEFSKHELKRVLDDLQGLEALFIDTLSQAADTTSGLAATTLRELAEHARHSGTAVGRQVRGTLTELSDSLLQAAKSQVKSGGQTLQAGGALLANLAAGFLAGIADRLQPTAPNKSEPPRKDSDD